MSIDPKILKPQTSIDLHDLADTFDSVKAKIESIRTREGSSFTGLLSGNNEEFGNDSLHDWFVRLFPTGGSASISAGLRKAALPKEEVETLLRNKVVIQEWMTAGCPAPNEEQRKALAKQMLG
jgi:hypothetical protein